jgi:hypothetical protein
MNPLTFGYHNIVFLSSGLFLSRNIEDSMASKSNHVVHLEAGNKNSDFPNKLFLLVDFGCFASSNTYDKPRVFPPFIIFRL